MGYYSSVPVEVGGNKDVVPETLDPASDKVAVWVSCLLLRAHLNCWYQ